MYTINNINGNKNNRFAILAEMGEQIFHIDDLANIWGITNKHTLKITLYRYVKSGMLKRIYRGLYSIKEMGNIDSRLIGIKAIHAPAYISCETILFECGIINQLPQAIDIVSGKSKRFSIGNYHYTSRKIKPQYLFNDAGINLINGIRVASPERALADMYYFNPKKYIDAHDSNLIDWKKYAEIVTAVGYNNQTKHVHHS